MSCDSVAMAEGCSSDAGGCEKVMIEDTDKALTCGRWTMAEMCSYLDGIRAVSDFPMYRRSGRNMSSTMDFLVPSRMEELFETQRASGGTGSVFPSCSAGA